MKLTVLMDNNTFIDEYYLGEPAVSYYIEDEGTKILFDAGYSDAFIRNAKAMNLDLAGLDVIAISHGHIDHTGGLPSLSENFDTQNIKLYAHPLTFEYKFLNGLDTGSPLSKEEVSSLYKTYFSKEPVQISENIIMLGEIPPRFDFEKRRITGTVVIKGQEMPDDNIDDTALVYKTKDGIYIITGCSHSGICGIIEYAKEVCKDTRVLGVIGGFHLLEQDEQLEGTVEYLRKEKIPELYPCHCVSLESKIAMAKHMPIVEVGVGMEIEWI
ncbi:MAG: MBL fold metallo-hydrolase [Candidatus Alkaliphilus sp. MAG34]|nr:MBL fold metallo-hydrolase [Clostridiales bacterium]